jgi:hypothetical protein
LAVVMPWRRKSSLALPRLTVIPPIF